MRTHVPEDARGLEFYAEVNELPTITETAVAVRSACSNMKLLAVIVGCETGVTLADELSEELGLRTNGTSIQRRNKCVQQDLVRAAGLRAVRQACGTKWSDVKSFVASESMPVVLKPVESAMSDGVKLCRSMEEAESHFEFLMHSQRAVGSQDSAVLCQEFLKGKEYVVDHVSRDGEHKTVMIYVYDKRPANGSQFVYHGMLPVASDSKIAQELIAYTRGVLDAIGIKHGPTHTEVMMSDDGPCLVEVNCRAHGGDGTWAPLAKALTGSYCQVDASVDAFLDEQRFLELPDVFPSTFKASGLNLMLVNNVEGVVQATPGYDRIRNLRSFVKLQTGVKKGLHIERTVDLLTCIGQVILIHPDPDILAEDVSVIRQMEKDCTILDLEKDRKMSAILKGA